MSSGMEWTRRSATHQKASLDQAYQAMNAMGTGLADRAGGVPRVKKHGPAIQEGRHLPHPPLPAGLGLALGTGLACRQCSKGALPILSM